jgi:hypothetical protein
MIGVVVWSNPAREKAVIWCEDNEALAYLQGALNLAPCGHWPQPGDLLEFEPEMVGALRFARAAQLLREQGWMELPDLLRQNSQMKGIAGMTGPEDRPEPMDLGAAS